MLTINFRLIQVLSLWYFKKYSKVTVAFELLTITLLLIINMLL